MSIDRFTGNTGALMLAMGCCLLVIKYSVLQRKDPFKHAMRLISFYFAMAGVILALFIVVEAPTAPSLGEFGAGKAAGILLGVFFGRLAICYIFFIPFFKRKLIIKDPRVRIWHVVLGPLLLKESTTLFWPGTGDEYITDYYEDAYGEVHAGINTKQAVTNPINDDEIKRLDVGSPSGLVNNSGILPSDPEKTKLEESVSAPVRKLKKLEPYERCIVPVKLLSWINTQKW
ncbi:hypothetical protein G6011_06397 [Alternaria panax]|uniref:Uncharacterized protein n=1 Tax=Alternaria panax TaxID=48097 RepID=A0AAD4FLA7_9PLEO|nr:hypothetical protein G6011_06397 [Alternaria panax]